MIASMRRYWAIYCVVFVYLVIGWLYAINVPAWQAPDEPAHYNYISQLANGRFPVIEQGDYDQAYLDEVRGALFAPEYSVSTIEYEDWQPPLYYLIQTPVFMLTNGNLLALRFTSVLIGAGVVIFSYLIAMELFPKNVWMPLTTAVFVAFLPQHVSILASVNNDSLAELLIAAILYTFFIWMRESTENRDRNRYFLVTIGSLIGLGLLTKLTVYLMVPVAALILIWRYWYNWDRLFRANILLFGPAFLLGSIWWIRNLLTYNGIDPLAMAAHNSVVVGQPRTTEWIALYGLEGTLQRFFQTTFNSFWGQFGWMAVVMDRRIYTSLMIFSIVVIVGLFIQLVSARTIITRVKKNRHCQAALLPIITLILVTFFTASIHVYYNLTFVQHQGRYLFPALIPIGIGVASSLDLWSGWIRELGKPKWETAVTALIPIGLGIALASLDLIALYKFILPDLTI